MSPLLSFLRKCLIGLVGKIGQVNFGLAVTCLVALFSIYAKPRRLRESRSLGL